MILESSVNQYDRNNSTTMGRERNRGTYKLGFLRNLVVGGKEQELKVETGVGEFNIF